MRTDFQGSDEANAATPVSAEGAGCNHSPLSTHLRHNTYDLNIDNIPMSITEKIHNHLIFKLSRDYFYRGMVKVMFYNFLQISFFFIILLFLLRCLKIKSKRQMKWNHQTNMPKTYEF